MATNLVLMEENKEVLELSKYLGFSKTLFLGKDFILIKGENKKELLKKIKEAKKKNLLVIVKPKSEEMLRFVLEKTPADMVFGQELINPEDSVHFRRGGLDQIVCKIARDKNKIIGFSFRELLEAKDRNKIMGRMMFNLKLCKKYKIKVFFSNFSEDKWEMRGEHDLKGFFEVLGGVGKEGKLIKI